jgi:hypothetical protein
MSERPATVATDDCPDDSHPLPLPDNTDEQTESVGSQLWAAFTEGAGAKAIGEEIVLRGRVLARHNIRAHIEKNDLDLPGTLACAKECGRRAAAYSSGGLITLEAFDKAWCELRLHRLDVISRLLRMRRAGGEHGELEIKGGACG